MSELLTAQETLATYLAANTSLDPVSSVVPRNPVAFGAYVWPGDPWVETPDQGTFCVTREVSLVCDLTASVTDLPQSQRWLADKIDEIWAACSDAVEVLPGRFVFPTTVDRPGISQPEGGQPLLVCTVSFSSFRLED